MKTKMIVAKNSLVRMFTCKQPGSKEIIVELGMAAIAVFLLLVFRGQMNALITTLCTKASTYIEALFGTVAA